MQAKLAVVILNYNTAHLLPKFLPSVVEHSRGCDLVFADNGSTDGSSDYVREHFPQFRVLELDRNYGFTGGYNRALQQVEADYYCLLNSDVEVTADWTLRPVELLEQNPDIAACQPKLLSYCEKKKFEYAGAAGGYIDYLGYPFCAGRIFEATEEDCGQYEQEREVFWASGAALFIKSELYHRFGGLDESFFAHMEEIDLCWRLKNAGYKIFYTPKSVIYHLGGGTLNKSSARKTYFNFRNNLLLLRKNLPEQLKSKILRRRCCLDLLAAGVFVLKGSFGEAKAVFRAHRDYKKMRQSLSLPTETVNGYPSCVYGGSIVAQAKILGKKTYGELKFKTR